MTGQGVEDQAILAAVRGVDPIRSVPTVTVSRVSGRRIIAVRVALPASLGLPEVVRVVDRVHAAVAALAPEAAVFVEPYLAVDPAAPTEAIVIRARE